jgi:hypothetical protein
MSDDFFNTDHKPDEQSETYFDKYVGEGLKYKDPEQLAKGYKNAEEMANNFKRQLDEMREEMGKQDHAQELLEKIKANQTDTNRRDNEGSTEPKQDGDKGLDNEALIRKLIGEEDARKRQDGNLKHITDTMKKAWGSTASSEFDKRLSDIGIDKESASQLAAKSPDAFFRLMGIDSTAKDTNTYSPLHSDKSFVGDSSASQPGDRNWAYYEQLRRSDKKKYFSVETQRNLMKDRKELGSRFGMPT